jgi:predicted O-methyltransferase YrrM
MNWQYFRPQFDYEKSFPNVDQISAWVGHKYFIYDFIRNVKPKVITELGTHYGASFFSMCQAVKDEKLDSKLYAVDTWKGDKHTGFYDKTVFAEVAKIKNTCYKNLKIQLLRKTFNQAASNFKEKSIDLLHIDGLHTYKAVRHDFDNWFNKVTENGVIILHDTHEKQDDFEVFKLWKELKEKFKTLEFRHSHGLGILFKNHQSFSKLFDFQEVWQHYYPIVFENKVLNKQLSEEQFRAQSLQNQVTTLNSQNTQLSQQLSQKTQENETLKKHIKEKNKKIKILEKQLKRIEKEKQKRAEELEKQNETIRQQIQQTQAHIQNLEATLNNIKSAKVFNLWQGYCHIRKFFLG